MSLCLTEVSKSCHIGGRPYKAHLTLQVLRSACSNRGERQGATETARKGAVLSRHRTVCFVAPCRKEEQHKLSLLSSVVFTTKQDAKQPRGKKTFVVARLGPTVDYA